MANFLTFAEILAAGPDAARVLSFPEMECVLGGIVVADGTSRRVARLEAASLVDLSSVRSALRATGRDDVLAVLEINQDCGILVRVTAGRERLCISHPAEAQFWTLAWDVVVELDPATGALEYELPTGDASILSDWGVSRAAVEGLLAEDVRGEEFVSRVVEALGVAAEFDALFPTDT